jgi:hypothetical protein
MSTQPTLITVSSRRAARASYPLNRVLERPASVAPDGDYCRLTDAQECRAQPTRQEHIVVRRDATTPGSEQIVTFP